MTRETQKFQSQDFGIIEKQSYPPKKKLRKDIYLQKQKQKHMDDALFYLQEHCAKTGEV